MMALSPPLTPRQTRELEDGIGPHLDAIKTLFKPGVKITVLVRSMEDPDGLKDFAMGDDDLQEAMNMIARRMASDKNSTANNPQRAAPPSVVP
jgi:hypothetical protein